MTSTTSTMQDHLDIVELHHRYAWSLDHRDWTMLADCFSPDGEVDYGMLGGQLKGATVIAEFCRQVLEGLDASQHLIGNTMVDLDGDRATATCYFQAQHVFVSDNGANTYIVAGTYTRRARPYRRHVADRQSHPHADVARRQRQRVRRGRRPTRRLPGLRGRRVGGWGSRQLGDRVRAMA